MSMDGAHTTSDQGDPTALSHIVEGMQHNNILGAANDIDEAVTSSGMPAQDRAKLSQALEQKLQQQGILPRALVEYATQNFDQLSNGDNYIHTMDLDNILRAGVESTTPVKGLFARSLRNRIDNIAIAHQDVSTFDDDGMDRDREIAKGISKRDLREWGEEIGKTQHHTLMSANMMKQFGHASKWSDLAGEDNLLSSGELEDALKDTFKFNPQQRDALNYMDQNFGGIRAARSGDSAFKMSLSDVVDWSAKYSIKPDQALPLESRTIEATIDKSNAVEAGTKLGVDLITTGLESGNVSQSLREFDHLITQNDLSADQVSAVTTGLGNTLSSNGLMNRVMGRYAEENFERLKGDNKYIHPDELNNVLSIADSLRHPSEVLVLKALRDNSNQIAMAHDDVTNNRSDSAEQSRGFSLKDATKFKEGSIEANLHRDMSVNIVEQFSNPSDFIKLSGGMEDLSAEERAKLQSGQFTQEEFDDKFSISKDELDLAKVDTLKYTNEERNTISYIRENYSTIKSAHRGDGGKITHSDLMQHAANHGVTLESLRAQTQAFEPLTMDGQVEENHVIAEDAQANKMEGQPLAWGSAAKSESQGREWTTTSDRRGQPVKGGLEWKTTGGESQTRERQSGGLEWNANQRVVERPREEIQTREPERRVAQSLEGAVRVEMQKGDRIWNIANQLYGSPQIEAVFEANGMKPQVGRDQNGQPVLLDPGYREGDVITFPNPRDVPRLREQYRQRASALREQFSERAGNPHEATQVQLMYGDTLSKLAMQKYGRAVPVEALFEANNLPPVFKQTADGRTFVCEPKYYAGRTYILPPIEHVNQLAQNYVNKYFRR